MKKCDETFCGCDPFSSDRCPGSDIDLERMAAVYSGALESKRGTACDVCGSTPCECGEELTVEEELEMSDAWDDVMGEVA